MRVFTLWASIYMSALHATGQIWLNEIVLTMWLKIITHVSGRWSLLRPVCFGFRHPLKFYYSKNHIQLIMFWFGYITRTMVWLNTLLMKKNTEFGCLFYLLVVRVIPLKLFYYQTFFETWRNEHSWYEHYKNAIKKCGHRAYLRVSRLLKWDILLVAR